MASYRELAGQTLQAVSGMPPEKIDFMPTRPYRRNAERLLDAKHLTRPTIAQNVPPATLSDSDFLDFDPFPDKPYVQPQKPLIGRLRKTITMADLAGTWEIGGASVRNMSAPAPIRTRACHSLAKNTLFVRTAPSIRNFKGGRAIRPSVKRTAALLFWMAALLP